MKNFLPTCLLVIFFGALQAQPDVHLLPDLSTFTVQNAGSTAFNYHCTDWENLSGCGNEAAKMALECPPWIIGGGGNWRSYFMNDGTGSSVCSAPYDIINNSAIDIKNTGTGPFVTSSSYITESGGNCPPAIEDWKRTYYGIWSAQYFNHPSAGTVSLGFMHAENRSNCTNGSICDATYIPYLSSYSDAPEGIAYTCSAASKSYYPTYAAFVCGTWIPNNINTNWGQGVFSNDMGPITWPSSGYLLPNGQKAGAGTGGPTSIIYNGYVWVFYLDMSYKRAPNDPPFAMEAGRHGGIKVVRAPLSDALNPLAYQAYYRIPNGTPAGIDSWSQALPAGFTKESIFNFSRSPGPLASNILDNDGTGDNYGEVRFSVAQVRNTNYFIGVESYFDNTDKVPGTNDGYMKVALRYSYDLTYWSNRLVIIDKSVNWTHTSLNYPIFLSTDGWSNNSVDATDFYVLGTTPGPDPDNHIFNIVNKVHVYIPPPPPPPPPPCGSPGADPCGFPCPNDPNSMCITRAGRIVKISGPGAALDGDPSSDPSSGLSSGISPNPGHGVYRLSYQLAHNARTQVNVLDLEGRAVRTGNPASRGPGRYEENIDISTAAKGVYLVELLVNGGRKTFKVVYN